MINLLAFEQMPGLDMAEFYDEISIRITYFHLNYLIG